MRAGDTQDQEEGRATDAAACEDLGVEVSALGDPLGSPLLRIPTDDTAVVRRTKSVSATRPLHDLDRNKESYGGGFWDDYDLMSLGLAVIDQVALAMGVSAGMLYDDARTYLESEAARQCPGAPLEQHAAVAARVLRALVGEDPHEYTYVDHAGDAPVRRVHSYQLLYEQWNADDTTHLRASAQAVNVLVNALDMDPESAAIASDFQIQELVRRGALDSAVAVAQTKRYVTIQYMEYIRGVVRDTLVDPDAFDWDEEVPAILARALDHVEERLASERALVSAIEGHRAAATDTALRQTANRLVTLLRESGQRHSELQRHLLRARGELRRAQDERFARSPGSCQRAEVEADLVLPALGAPTRRVAPWCEGLLARVGGLHQPALASGAVLLDELFEAPRDPATGEPLPDPTFAETAAIVWWEPYWGLADALIASLTAPTRLGTLIERALSVAEEHLDVQGSPLDRSGLVAAVCHVAHEHIATPFAGAERDTAVVVAIPTGTRLATAGIDADDLLLAPVVLGPTPPETPEATLTTMEVSS